MPDMAEGHFSTVDECGQPSAFIFYKRRGSRVMAEKCAICKEPMRYYLKRRNFKTFPVSVEKVCFNCATGGGFRKKEHIEAVEE